MGEKLKALVTYFIPAKRNLVGEDLRRHRLMVAFLLITALYAASYVPLCIAIDYYSALVSIPITFVVCITLSFALRRGAGLVLVCNVYLFSLSTQISWLWISTGGLTTTPNDQAFSALFPAIALLLIGRKWAVVWLIYCILLVVAHGIPGIMGYDFPQGMNADYVKTFTVISLAGHAILLYVFVNLFETSRDRAHKQLELTNAALAIEQQKTESLLLNILPAEVAEELKATGHAEAHEFDQVTILFSDFKNFTSISEDMSPKELVEELNACFMAFDAIVGEHNVEKIKTIGDAYMAAAGLQKQGWRSAADVVLAGLRMQVFMQTRNAQRMAIHLPAFEMRIGIHTGTVVAGIVGVKKFQYDIWGDAVNTAARMEQNGAVGQVNVSNATYELLANDDRFAFTARDKIEVKGKGDVRMHFAELRKGPME